MDPSDKQQPIQQQLTDDLEQVKQQSKTRLQRIKAILAIAFSAALAEAKGGTAEVRETGQRSVGKVLQTLRTAPQSAPYEQLRQRAKDWDEQLTQRYGDNYAALKQRSAQAAAWYQTKLAAGQNLDSQGIAQRQTDLADDLGQAGSKIAQREDALKQKVRQALKTITVTADS